MGFKIKNLGTPFRNFTANVGPVNLTAGVPVAEIYLGLYAQMLIKATKTVCDTLGTEISEITVTRRGETVVSIENGMDLLALELLPWFDHNITYTSGGSSAHYQYVKGLTLPCNYPIGVSGEFQLTVETGNAAYYGSEVLSIAEGQGYYQQNWFPQADLEGKHFHIVKRLYTPAATGWNSGFDIGTEGDLVGLVIFQTTEEDRTVAKGSISLYEIQLDIGGETVVKADCLTQQGRMGSRYGGQSGSVDQAAVDEKGQCFDQYIPIDFAGQYWDCRGKTVTLMTNAGTADAIRAYPIYLVDA